MTVDDDGVKLVTLAEAAEVAGYSLRTMRNMVAQKYLTSWAVEPIHGGWRHWFRRPDVLQAAAWWEKDHPRGNPKLRQDLPRCGAPRARTGIPCRRIRPCGIHRHADTSDDLA